MSEPKFTKGPWETDFDLGATCVLGADEAMVADCAIATNPRYRQDRSEKVVRANAHLIAAAPDLYAVETDLDRLSLVIESAVRNADPKRHDEIVALIRANRAALAKARGEAA